MDASWPKKTGVSPDGIKQHIAKLKSGGLLERIGGRKEGHWKVIK
jgi:predicted HTH transcriptional regulator